MNWVTERVSEKHSHMMASAELFLLILPLFQKILVAN